MSRFSRFDPVTGIRKTLLIDPSDPRRMCFRQEQAGEEHLYEVMKQLRNDQTHVEFKSANGTSGRLLCDIPAVDFANLKREFPELSATGPGAAEIRHKTLRRILKFHPDAHKWRAYTKSKWIVSPTTIRSSRR